MGPYPKEVRVLITVVENKVGKSRKKGQRADVRVEARD